MIKSHTDRETYIISFISTHIDAHRGNELLRNLSFPFQVEFWLKYAADIRTLIAWCRTEKHMWIAHAQDVPIRE